MDKILSLDLGTTAIKVALFDEQGALLAKASLEYELSTPSALEVELDVERYWSAFKQGVWEVLAAHRM